MAQAKRRVSYVIPPPQDPQSVPRLTLPPHGAPRLGAISPLLVPLASQNNSPDSGHHHPHPHSHPHPQSRSRRPRHRLGVASLALDTSTQLLGRSCPEGILYTGGRDGLVISWDLGIATKRRAQPTTKSDRKSAGKWELLTGWAGDVIDEEGEDEDTRFITGGDGDVLGDVEHPRKRRSGPRAGEIPYEQQWEMDSTAVKPGFRSHFRQCAEAHSDWVNDIVLCNYNQTLVSASSDGTIKAWNPHPDGESIYSEPSQVGSHNDYVRCLSNCREQSWIASGSFDRTIKLWDLSISCSPVASSLATVGKAKGVPVVTLTPPDVGSPKSSVYALACDPFGRMIASGSPERVVRLWDPRTGRRTGKLVGHTDNIRAILISEDAKYLLTGSADASIKLWSLTSQRCLHTFTHHTDSVWSLFSTHPSLEVFYSGDRSGLVCRVDVEGCTDVGDGECIVLCQDSDSASVLPSPSLSPAPGNASASGDSGIGVGVGGSTTPLHGHGSNNHHINASRGSATSEGVNKIVVMDDQLLWTASGTSSVRRWGIPPRRLMRVVHVPNISSDADGERIPFVQDSPTMQRRYGRRSPSPPLRSATGSSTQQQLQTYYSLSPSPRASFAPSLAASMTSLSSETDPPLNSSPPGSSYHHHLSPHSRSNPHSFSYSGGGTGIGPEEGDKLNGIPMDSLVKLVSANDPFSASYSYSYPSRMRDAEVVTLYSAASVMSVPRMTIGHAPAHQTRPIVQGNSFGQSAMQHQQTLQRSSSIPGLQSSGTEDTLTHTLHSGTHPILSSHHPPSSLSHPSLASPTFPPTTSPTTSTLAPQHVHTQSSLPPNPTARANYEDRDLAADAVPLLSSPDEVIKGDHGLVRSVILNDRIHVLTVDTSGEVKIWDVVRGVCKGRFEREEVYAASRGGSVSGVSLSQRGAVSTKTVGGGGGGKGDVGGGLVVVVDGGEVEKERSPREALEVVRERIEGEAVVQSWCTTDTKAGVLVVHVGEKCFEAEVYADEVGFSGDKRMGEEAKLNIGKWVLRNLFIGFIREEQRTRKRGSEVSESGDAAGTLLAPSLARTPLSSQNTSTTSSVARSSTDSTQPSYHSHHSHSHSYSHPYSHSHLHSHSHSHLHAHTKNGSSSGGGHHSRRTSASSSSTSADRTKKSTPTSTPTASTTHHHHHHHRQSTSQIVVQSSKMTPAVIPPKVPGTAAKNSPFIAPLIPLNTKDGLGVVRQSTTGDPVRKTSADGGVVGSATTPVITQGDYFALRTRHVSLQGHVGAEEAAAAAAAATTTINATPTAAAVGNATMTSKPESQNSSSAGGLMGRLRNLGRSATKRPTSDGGGLVSTSPALGGVVPASVESTAVETTSAAAEIAETAVQLLLSGPLSPPTSTDAPIHHMPPNTTLLIAEEGTPGYNVMWRGNAGTTHLDVQALEESMPMWLMDYLLINKLPASSSGATAVMPKISFVLVPWNKDPDVEALPELLNTQQSKLTANRNLRVRKIAIHVHEKLEKMTHGSRAPSIRSSVDDNGSGKHSHSRSNSAKGPGGNASISSSTAFTTPTTTPTLTSTSAGTHHHRKPEDEYEILCNDTLLPLTMTLAAVRQYVWKQSSELVMQYRRKVPVPVVSGSGGRSPRM